jgi:hypothetical protein
MVKVVKIMGKIGAKMMDFSILEFFGGGIKTLL